MIIENQVNESLSLNPGWVLIAGDGDDSDLNKPLDKGKGKATDDDFDKPLDKGKGKAIDGNSDDSGSGSDIESDDDLDSDIIDELETLYKLPPTKENLDRRSTLIKLLKGVIDVPKPPVPDFWGHYTKPAVKENTDKEHALTPDSLTTENTGKKHALTPDSPTTENVAKKPKLTEDTSTENIKKGEGSSTSSSSNSSKCSNCGSNTGCSCGSSSSSGGGGIASTEDMIENIQKEESSIEKHIQTPTEYVAELESFELPSYIWDDSD
jgi:hypothetical protein